MAIPQNFRSALGGFNREDVVHYIEYINAKHTAEVNQLKSEIDFLKTKAASPAEDPETLQALADIRQERDALIAKVAELEDQCTAPSPRVQELEERCRSLEAELKSAVDARDLALRQQNSQQCHIEQELEAYRRAERAERVAKERAELVYHKTNGALADATAKVDAAAAQISSMTDTVVDQLNQLQAAVSSSKLALKDAAATMYTIRPTSAEE